MHRSILGISAVANATQTIATGTVTYIPAAQQLVPR